MTSKRRLVVHWRKELFDVYIGRPSKWGNPFSSKQGTLADFRVASTEEALASYERWLLSQPELVAMARNELRGKVLGCWCAPKKCHGDILARVANEGPELSDEIFTALLK